MVYANGEPIDGSNISGSGDITPLQKSSIILDEETISIKLDGDFANVNVDYRFLNTGQSDKVTYGFPVDIYKENNLYDKFDKKCLPSFEIRDGNTVLPTKEKIDDKVITIKQGKHNLNLIRKWYITELDFPAGETKDLRVSYRIKNSFEDWEFPKSFFPEYDDRVFTYRLSPSNY